MPKTKETLKASVVAKVNVKKNGFDLSKFKKTKHLDETSKFKKQEFFKLSPAFQEALSIPGLPKGHITLLRGHSDTGKTTAMIEAIISVQKEGSLPVIIVTEMKWSWDHAIAMGVEATQTVDKETGEISYDGNFIYIDRGSLNTVEDVAAFMADLLDEQEKGNIPLDLVFLWDSAGSIPCQQSYDSKKNNNMWNAGAMATQFGNFINQKITLSRKDTQKYTNTFIVVNKVRVEVPMGNVPGAMPKLRNKGGDALLWDATYVITFGNVTGPGTVKVKATRDGKNVEWAKIVRASVDKNHMTGISTSGKLVTTIHGFIREEDKEKYKKQHSPEWAKILGGSDFQEILEEDNTDLSIAGENDD